MQASDMLKSLYFIISLNTKIQDNDRRLSDMIDSYFLGFQAGLLQFDPTGIKMTLGYIMMNNLELSIQNAGIGSKLKNYENQMLGRQSIKDIIPFSFDDELQQVEAILEKIEISLNKSQQQGGIQKPIQQQKKQEQSFPQFYSQKSKPEEDQIWKKLLIDEQNQKAQQKLKQFQEPFKQQEKVEEKQVKIEIPPSKPIIEGDPFQQLLQQQQGVPKKQPEVKPLDSDPIKNLGDILEGLKQNSLENQPKPSPQKMVFEQPQKIIPQPKPIQQLIQLDKQQQQQPIIQIPQIPVLQQINDISPSEQMVIMKLVKQHLKDTYSKKKICTICLTDMTEESAYSLTKCQHTFHLACLKDYGENQSEIPIKCPQQGCKQEYGPDDLAKTISKKKRETLDQHSFNKFVLKNQQDYFQCPTPGCQSVYLIEGQFQICTNCQQMFCTKCRQEFHDGDCGDDKFQKIAMKENFSQCLKCFHWVEKTYGCNHIQCVCGHQFCYNCQKEWVGEECKCIEEEQFQGQQMRQQAVDFNQMFRNLMQAASQRQQRQDQ